MRTLKLLSLATIFFFGIASAHDPKASPILPAAEHRVVTPLSERELAFIVGSRNLADDIIDLINQHVIQELAAGKKRITVLTELREVFKYTGSQEFSGTEWAIIAAGVAALATTVFFLLKWLIPIKEKPSTTPPLNPVPAPGKDDEDIWEDIPLDSPIIKEPAERPTFDHEMDLDLDNTPKRKKTRTRPSLLERTTY